MVSSVDHDKTGRMRWQIRVYIDRKGHKPSFYGALQYYNQYLQAGTFL